MTQYPLLPSLDPYHQRLGYVNGVIMSAARALDSCEALLGRFDNLMLKRIHDDNPLYNKIYSQYQVDLDKILKAKDCLKNTTNACADHLR